MCSIESARESLVTQICAAEKLLRSLPGSSHPKCFIDLTDAIGLDVIGILRLNKCPASGILRICIDYFDLEDASQIDAGCRPLASVALADLEIRSLMMVGPFVPELIQAAKSSAPELATAAQQLATDIELALRTDSGDCQHTAKVSRANKSPTRISPSVACS